MPSRIGVGQVPGLVLGARTSARARPVGAARRATLPKKWSLSEVRAYFVRTTRLAVDVEDPVRLLARSCSGRSSGRRGRRRRARARAGARLGADETSAASCRPRSGSAARSSGARRRGGRPAGRCRRGRRCPTAGSRSTGRRTQPRGYARSSTRVSTVLPPVADRDGHAVGLPQVEADRHVVLRADADGREDLEADLRPRDRALLELQALGQREGGRGRAEQGDHEHRREDAGHGPRL